MKRVSSRSLRQLVMAAAAPAALLLGAGTASAQWSAQQSQRYPQPQQRYPDQQRQQQSRYGQQELFEWQGRVDREIRIQMNGDRASVIQIGNNERTNGRVRSVAAMPNQDGYITVQQIEGRGTVDVVQQPTDRNGYNAIVRLRDPESGAAMYRIVAYWQPTGNSSVYRNGPRRGHGNRGNGDGDEGDDDDNGGYHQNHGHHKWW